MEVVEKVKMRLHIKTDLRVLDEEFDNIFEMKTFMDNFFQKSAERRKLDPANTYQGPERRGQIQ